jgi:hypothetical protein
LFGHIAAIFLPLAVMYALGPVIPMWASALIVGGALLLAALTVGAIGRRKLATIRLKPDQALATLQEDTTWIQRPLS